MVSTPMATFEGFELPKHTRKKEQFVAVLENEEEDSLDHGHNDNYSA